MPTLEDKLKNNLSATLVFKLDEETLANELEDSIEKSYTEFNEKKDKIKDDDLFVGEGESVLSSDAVDLAGEVVKQEGLDYKRFLEKNPIGYFNHRSREMPIIKFTEIYQRTGSEGKMETVGKFKFVSEKINPLGPQVYYAWKAGVLNEVSIGFRVVEFAKNDKGETDYSIFEKSRLMEVSICGKACNDDATKIKEIDEDVMIKCKDLFSNLKEGTDYVIKKAPAKKPVKEDEDELDGDMEETAKKMYSGHYKRMKEIMALKEKEKDITKGDLMKMECKLHMEMAHKFYNGYVFMDPSDAPQAGKKEEEDEVAKDLALKEKVTLMVKEALEKTESKEFKKEEFFDARQILKDLNNLTSDALSQMNIKVKDFK